MIWRLGGTILLTRSMDITYCAIGIHAGLKGDKPGFYQIPGLGQPRGRVAGR